VLQPGDDPSEGRRINADRAATDGGVLAFYVGDDPVSFFYEWTEAHRIEGDWPDRPVGEVDPEADPW
jgi:hypothetical protein